MSHGKIVYSSALHKTLKEFSDGVTIIKPCRFSGVGDYDQKNLADIEFIYVYGAFHLDNGLVDGCHIECMKNGSFAVTVGNDGIVTKNLEEAETFLFNEWYIHEFN